MRWLWLPVFAGLLFSTTLVRAQGEVRGTAEVGAGEGEETVGESRIAYIHAVERGLWFQVDYGPYYQIPFSLPQEMCAVEDTVGCLGSNIGLRVGYDILNNLEADFFIRGTYANFVMDYGRVYSGDVSSYYTGVSARFSYITTQRFHATIRGGGGVAVLVPAAAAGGGEGDLAVFAPAVDAALGLEYFTLLRHISVGLEISTIAYVWPSFTMGFTAMPTFKYTF